MYDNYHIDGCIEMFGAHIRSCIADYLKCCGKEEKYSKYVEEIKRKLKKNKDKAVETKLNNILHRIRQALYDYHTAKQYLFGSGIEYHCDIVGFPIDYRYVREQVLGMAKNKNLYSEPLIGAD